MIALAIASADPGCAASPAELMRLAADAEQAWLDVDVPAFEAAADALGAAVRCADSPLTARQAATVHLVLGLRAFTAGDEVGADRALAAYRAVLPGDERLDDLLPPGHPARAQADPDDRSEVLASPERGTVVLDGRPGLDRPLGRAVLAQWTDGDAVLTSYLWHDAGALAYPVAAPAPPTPVERRRPAGWLIAAGGAAAASGALYGGAMQYAAAYRAAAADYDEGPRLRSRARALTVASGGAAALATGLVVGAAISW